jgi:hypothetical protein
MLFALIASTALSLRGFAAHRLRGVFVFLSLLAAIEEAGEEEEHGEHQGELGVSAGVQMKLYDSIDCPGGASYEPDPGGLSHR